VVSWNNGLLITHRGVFHPNPLINVFRIGLRQFSWWILRPLIYFLARFTFFAAKAGSNLSNQISLPRKVSILCCWLNPFTADEVRQWQACGVTSIPDLLEKIPNRQSYLVHAQRRACWPLNCKPALELLHHKDRLLALAPQAWIKPYLALAIPSGDGEGALPPWWQEALLTHGVVIKPNCGNASRAIVHYFVRQGSLEVRVLFDRPIEPVELDPVEWTPQGLKRHWERLAGSHESALIQPYVIQHQALPQTDPAVVIRLTTQRADPQGEITVRQPVLEIPLSADPSSNDSYGPVIFMGLAGLVVPMPAVKLIPLQQAELDRWLAVVKQPPAVILACLEGAREMHRRLPPIDSVAWDWIPAPTGPILLEGNGNHGLMMDQMLEMLST